jgi:hypothetical protein
MKTESKQLVIGKIYWLKGGQIMRFQGRFGSDNEADIPTGYCGAFRPPPDPVMSPATGYSVPPSGVLREVTIDDVEALIRKREELLLQHLYAQAGDIAFVIQELKNESNNTDGVTRLRKNDLGQGK